MDVEMLNREIERCERNLVRANNRAGVTREELEHLRNKLQGKRELRDKMVEYERELAKYRDKVKRDAETIKAHEESLHGWAEVQRVNEAMIAALLVIYGAGAESPAVIGREMLQQMMAGYRVAVSCEQESGEYKLSYMRVEQEESKE